MVTLSIVIKNVAVMLNMTNVEFAVVLDSLKDLVTVLVNKWTVTMNAVENKSLILVVNAVVQVLKNHIAIA